MEVGGRFFDDFSRRLKTSGSTLICMVKNAEANDQFMAALNYVELRTHWISPKQSQRCMEEALEGALESNYTSRHNKVFYTRIKRGVLVQGIHESHRPSRLINIDLMDYIRDSYGGLVLDLLLGIKLLTIGFARRLYVKTRIVSVDNNFGQSEPMKSGYGITTKIKRFRYRWV